MIFIESLTGLRKTTWIDSRCYQEYVFRTPVFPMYFKTDSQGTWSISKIRKNKDPRFKASLLDYLE